MYCDCVKVMTSLLLRTYRFDWHVAGIWRLEQRGAWFFPHRDYQGHPQV